VTVSNVRRARVIAKTGVRRGVMALSKFLDCSASDLEILVWVEMGFFLFGATSLLLLRWRRGSCSLFCLLSFLLSELQALLQFCLRDALASNFVEKGGLSSLSCRLGGELTDFVSDILHSILDGVCGALSLIRHLM